MTVVSSLSGARLKLPPIRTLHTPCTGGPHGLRRSTLAHSVSTLRRKASIRLTTFDGSGTAVIWGIVCISKSRRSNTEPRSLDWTKRSKDTGQFMDQKDQGKFKGVRRER